MEFVLLALFVCLFGLGISALVRRSRSRKPQRNSQRGSGGLEKDWKLVKYVRHDGVERDEYTHQHMLRTNSVYRDAVGGASAALQDRGKPATDRSDWEFEITYQNKRGEVSVRRIKQISFNGERDPLITALSEKTGEERSFRSSNILACTNLESGRAIKDFGTYLKRGYGWR